MQWIFSNFGFITSAFSMLIAVISLKILLKLEHKFAHIHLVISFFMITSICGTMASTDIIANELKSKLIPYQQIDPLFKDF